nr:uncharacterized protein LOC117689309 [Crassostrea gigas]
MKISYICISIFVTFLGVQGSPCPVGYHYTEKNGYCCQSVVCPKDHQFHLCTFDGGSDTCTPCDKGQINLDEIHTKEWSYELDDLCHVPDCDCSVPDTVIDNLQECMESTGRPVCVCNRKDWFYGQDPFWCNLANSSLKLSATEKGVELTQDGTVRPCPPGYFKSQYGGSICSPHSKCPQGYTVDIQGTEIQDTTCKRSLSSSVPTTPATSSSTEADLKSEAEKSDIWIVILIVAVAIVVVVSNCTIVFVCWLKRRQTCTMESTIKFLNKKKQQGTGKEDNNLTLLKQVNNQNEDYQNAAMNSIPADHVEEKGDEERSLLILKNKENVSLAESNENQDSHGCSLPDQVGISMSMSSMLEEPSLSNSEMTSKEGDGLDLNNIPIAQENSYERHSLPTSRDLGIGLSADFKVENEIQKLCQKQTKQKQHVQQHQ